ncbi:MAG: transcriptional regulator [Hyphomicrobiales bacterium]|nr:transcriptional regulator [Hyphomicrobiales bacterium]
MNAGSRLTFVRGIALVIYLVAGMSSVGQAAELVMFRQALCEWCEVWDDEVGVVYNKTQEGRLVPIRQIDIHDQRPDDLRSIRPVVFTPTFVLVDDGKEIGRIQGYPGEDFFWGLLNQMLGRMPAEG